MVWSPPESSSLLPLLLHVYSEERQTMCGSWTWLEDDGIFASLLGL